MHTVDIGGKQLQLTAKEKRLFDYYVECEERKFQPTIGDICDACHTTVLTLFKKTMPSLDAKIKDLSGEIQEEVRAPLGLDDKAVEEWLQREG